MSHRERESHKKIKKNTNRLIENESLIIETRKEGERQRETQRVIILRKKEGWEKRSHERQSKRERVCVVCAERQYSFFVELDFVPVLLNTFVDL